VPARPLAATRRTALVVTAGLTGLAACTTESPDEPADPASTSAPPVDADQELVDETAQRIAETNISVQQVGEDFPALRGALRPLERMHAAHLEAVGGFEGSVSTDGAVGGGRSQAMSEVLTAQRQLQRALATAAVRAESGTLAKLFASMSAAVAQHLVVLG